MNYGERFEEVLRYAARLHQAQMRKGANTPCVMHLLAVAAKMFSAKNIKKQRSISRREEN